MASSTTNEKVGVGEQDPQNQKNLQNPQNGEELGTPATESTEQTAEPGIWERVHLSVTVELTLREQKNPQAPDLATAWTTLMAACLSTSKT